MGEIQGRRMTSVPIFFPPFLLFFRGDQKILSPVGHAAFARLTPWPNPWHNRAMKAGFISIFRAFHLKPSSESHSPDSADSLIFFVSGRQSAAFPDRRDKLLKRHCGVPISQQSPRESPDIKGLGGPAFVLERDALPARFVVRGDPAAFFLAVMPVLVDLVINLPVANFEDVENGDGHTVAVKMAAPFGTGIFSVRNLPPFSRRTDSDSIDCLSSSPSSVASSALCAKPPLLSFFAFFQGKRGQVNRRCGACDPACFLLPMGLAFPRECRRNPASD